MRVVLLLIFSLCSFFLQSENIKMADQMRENGKIYVVVAVVLVILIGLLLYLIQIDRKVSKLEKENLKNKEK